MRMRFAVLGTVIGIAIGAGVSRAYRWWKTWGIVADEVERALPGDEVVPDAVAS